MCCQFAENGKEKDFIERVVNGRKRQRKYLLKEKEK